MKKFEVGGSCLEFETGDSLTFGAGGSLSAKNRKARKHRSGKAAGRKSHNTGERLPETLVERDGSLSRVAREQGERAQWLLSA